MRTLVIGVPLPNSTFDNYSFVSAPSFSEYGRLIVDVAAASRVIDEIVAGEGAYATFGGQAIVNGESSSHAFALADVLLMRRREGERLVERGALVIAFAQPDARHTGVVGIEDWRRYGWLPQPDGFSYAEDLLPGFGRPGVVVSDEAHPFAEYGRVFGAKAAYRTVIREHAASPARVFLRSNAGDAVGAEVPLGAGALVLLPPPDKSANRTALAETLLQCMEGWQNKTPAGTDGDQVGANGIRPGEAT